jgi:hypothetical protein
MTLHPIASENHTLSMRSVVPNRSVRAVMYTVKLKIEYGEMLRDIYPYIRTGWHTNKKP